MRPLIPHEYALAYDGFRDAAIDSIVHSDALLKRFPSRRVRHRASVRHVSGPSAIDHRLEPAGQEIHLAAEAVRHGQVNAHTENLWNVAQSVLRDRVSRLLTVVTDIQQATGRQSVSTASPWDAYLQALEQISLQFDSQGRCLGAQILMNPETASKFEATPMPAEVRERVWKS